jgi:hypothetical protein
VSNAPSPGLAAFPDDLEDRHVPGIRVLRAGFYGQATVEAIAIGLPLGLIDVHSRQGGWFDAHLAFLLAGVLLGVRHAGRAWQAWGPLGFCHYVMHRLAIAYGYRPPYVEEDARSALLCFVILWPALVGLGLGMLFRLAITALVRASRKRQEEPATDLSTEAACRGRFTVSRLMLIIALIGVNLAAARMLFQSDCFFGFGTVYAQGYSESRFHRVRVGMNPAEVEAIMGEPLLKGDWGCLIASPSPGDRDTWRYSNQHHYTANFWRRWVIFEKGKVVDVVSDFWVD